VEEGEGFACLQFVFSVLYNGILSNHCEQDIKEYCTTVDCRRAAMFAPFGEKPKETIPRHDCCDNCAENCSCGSDNCNKAFNFDISQTVEFPGPSNVTMRAVTKENKLYLKAALENFRKAEVSKHSNKLEQLVSCPNVLLELGDFFINQVLENCHKILNVEDVFNYVKVWRQSMHLLTLTLSVVVLATSKKLQNFMLS